MGSNTSITHTTPALLFERRHPRSTAYAHHQHHSQFDDHAHGKRRKVRVTHSLNGSSSNPHQEFLSPHQQLLNLNCELQQTADKKGYVHRSNDDLIFSKSRRSSATSQQQQKQPPLMPLSPKKSSNSSLKQQDKIESFTPITPFSQLPKVESESNFIMNHTKNPNRICPPIIIPENQCSAIENKLELGPQKSDSPSKLPRLDREKQARKSNIVTDSTSSLGSLKSEKLSKSRPKSEDDDLVIVEQQPKSPSNIVNRSIKKKDCVSTSTSFSKSLPSLNENLGNQEIHIIVTPPPCLPDLSHLNVSHCKLRLLSNEISQKRKMSRDKRESLSNNNFKPIVLR